MIALVLDVLLGPRCLIGCGYRARGWRTLTAHMRQHGWEPADV